MLLLAAKSHFLGFILVAILYMMKQRMLSEQYVQMVGAIAMVLSTIHFIVLTPLMTMFTQLIVVHILSVEPILLFFSIPQIPASVVNPCQC